MLASSQESSQFMDAAADMRRFFGSCGGAARQDVLITEDMDGDMEATETRRRARRPKKRRNKRRVKKEGRRPQGQWGQSDRGWPDIEWVQSPHWVAKSAS